LKGREIALKALLFYENLRDADASFSRAIKGIKSQKLINRSLEIFYGVLRWLYRIDYILNKHLHKKTIDKIHIWTRNIMRIGAFERIIMGVPDYASVSEAVKLAKKYGHRGTVGLANAVLRNLSDVEYPDEELKRLSVYYSFPEWLVAMLLEIFGDETEAFLKASNRTPPLSVRVNRLKTNRNELIKILKQSRMKADKGRHSPWSIYTEGRALKSRFFREGMFTVQDESSTLALEWIDTDLDVYADLCSSPGGKATHLAEITGDKKIIVAGDLRGMNRVVENIRRLNLKSIKPVIADARQISLRNVDMVILDVPCSGLGTLARRVDLKYRLTPERINSLVKIQKEILENASTLVKSGGYVYYITCTVNPEENQILIKKFLAKMKNFGLIEYEGEYGGDGFFQTLPHVHGIDGVFGAMIKRR